MALSWWDSERDETVRCFDRRLDLWQTDRQMNKDAAQRRMVKIGHVTVTAGSLAVFVTCILNLCTKFEDSSPIQEIWRNIKDFKIGMIQSGYWLVKVSSTVTIRQYNFLPSEQLCPCLWVALWNRAERPTIYILPCLTYIYQLCVKNSKMVLLGLYVAAPLLWLVGISSSLPPEN